MNQQQPSFIMHVGPMASGKTSAMLAYVDRCRYQKREVVAFKPSIDKRYSLTKIMSHGGWSIDAISVDCDHDVLFESLSRKPDVIALDEAFMIPGIANVLRTLHRHGMTVIISTLDMSYECEPFKEVESLLGYATHVEKHASVCTICRSDARYTYKLIKENDELVQVGGLDVYEPRCYFHHPVFMKG